MEPKQISRINELSKIAKLRDLTPEENEERQKLRAAYLADFRKSFRSQLDSTKVEFPNGERLPLREANQKCK